MSGERSPVSLVRTRVFVSGIVQGVGFRYATEREARRLGLSGWVRNTADGRVEILAEGTFGQVEQLLTWCHTGPSAARVSDVEHCDEIPDGAVTGFRIRF